MGSGAAVGDGSGVTGAVVGCGVGTAASVAVGLGKTTATVGSGVGVGFIVGTGVGVGFIVGTGVGVAAGVAERTHDVMVMVTNEDEAGRVTFWRDGADATTAAIMVGDELGGAVDDSDGNPGDTFPIAMYKRIDNVTSWQWAKTMTPDMMDSWMDIGTGGMYTVMDDDEGYYLRATAMYTDGHGSGKSKEAVSAKAVDAEGTGDPLLAKYDKSGDDKIDLDEALGAVAIYFEISRSDALPEAKAAAEVEVLDVVARYFSDRRGAR